MENHHAINGKTHYFDWAIINSYVSHYQRINPIKITILLVKPHKNHNFPMVFLWFSKLLVITRGLSLHFLVNCSPGCPWDKL